MGGLKLKILKCIKKYVIIEYEVVVIKRKCTEYFFFKG